MPSQELLQDFARVSLLAWRKDPAVFLEDCIKIKTVNGREPFRLRNYQRESLTAFQTSKKLVVLKARQIGYSTLVAAYALWKAMLHDDQVVIMFSDKEDDAKKLLAKAIYAYNHLDGWVADLLPQRLDRAQLAMNFTNGSRIEVHPATESTGRGETATLAILDEWAFFGHGSGEKAEVAWSAIEPTIELGGQFIGLSTANGIENFFYTIWESAANDSDWRRLFFPYSVVPGRDEKWWERKLREYQNKGIEWVIHQEYPREPEEAFVKSGQTVFDVDRLKQLQTAMKRGTRGRLEDLRLIEEPYGALEVWVPPEEGCDYVIGADVAEGLEHGDFSDATVILATDQQRKGAVVYPRGTVVARWRGKIDADLFGDVIDQLGRWYRTALVAVEANNHGLSVLHRLKELNYPRLYRTRTLDQVTNRETLRLGWYTNKKSKPAMIDDLVRALRTGDIIFWCDTLRREMMSYMRQPNGQLGLKGVKDDAVISAAIAWQMLDHVFDPFYIRNEPEVPYWSVEWWAQQADELAAGRKGQPWM